MRERRKHPRIEEPHRITVHMVPESNLGYAEIVSVPHVADDISRNGIRFRAFDRLPVEAFLRIDIDLGEEAGPLSMSGVIRWVATVTNDLRYTAGVEFFDLPGDADRRRWITYVSDRIQPGGRVDAPRAGNAQRFSAG